MGSTVSTILPKHVIDLLYRVVLSYYDQGSFESVFVSRVCRAVWLGELQQCCACELGIDRSWRRGRKHGLQPSVCVLHWGRKSKVSWRRRSAVIIIVCCWCWWRWFIKHISSVQLWSSWTVNSLCDICLIVSFCQEQKEASPLRWPGWWLCFIILDLMTTVNPIYRAWGFALGRVTPAGQWLDFLLTCPRPVSLRYAFFANGVYLADHVGGPYTKIEGCPVPGGTCSLSLSLYPSPFNAIMFSLRHILVVAMFMSVIVFSCVLCFVNLEWS